MSFLQAQPKFDSISIYILKINDEIFKILPYLCRNLKHNFMEKTTLNLYVMNISELKILLEQLYI